MPRGIKAKNLKELPDELRYFAHIAGSKNPGFIYFLISEQLNLIKIGASNRWNGHRPAVLKRIQEVRNDAPMIPINREIVILAAVLEHNEAQIHKNFSTYLVGGEWFQYTDELKHFVGSVERWLQQNELFNTTEDAPLPIDKPWKLLKQAVNPPGKKFKGLKAMFE